MHSVFNVQALLDLRQTEKKPIVNHLKPSQYRWCRASQDLMGDVHVGRGPEAVPPAHPLLGLVLTCSLMVEALEAPRSEVTCLRSHRSEHRALSSLHHQVQPGCTVMVAHPSLQAVSYLLNLGPPLKQSRGSRRP